MPATAGTASPASTSTRRSRRFPGRGSSSTARVARSTTSACRARLSPGYAPAGRALVSVTILGSSAPDLDAVDASFGRGSAAAATSGVTCGRTGSRARCRATPSGARSGQPARLAPGLYACGDHREHPSLNGALASGRRAAEAVLADGGLTSGPHRRAYCWLFPTKEGVSMTAIASSIPRVARSVG